MNQNEQIAYWSTMLDEAMDDKAFQRPLPDLSGKKGSMTQIIADQIMEPLGGCRTVQDVYDLVDSVFKQNGLSTPASNRLLSNIRNSRDLLQAMSTVAYSYNAGKTGKRTRTYEDEQLDERRMTGPAAAARGGTDEIAEFRGQLAAGVVEFEFTKADGTRRHAVGTTNEQVVPTAERRRLDPQYDENLAAYQRRQAYIIWFWDLEKNACRCFNTNRFEGIVHFEPTNRHIDGGVERVGDIFIHRDVDAGETQAVVAQEDIDGMNGDLDSTDIQDGIWTAALGGPLRTADQSGGISFERSPSGEPVLRMVIRKRGTDSDEPYQLRINDLRRYIIEQWNVDVKKVVVDGEFSF